MNTRRRPWLATALMSTLGSLHLATVNPPGAATASPGEPPAGAGTGTAKATPMGGSKKSPAPKGPPGNSRPSDAVSATDLTVLQKLHDSNQMEIQMGHLAQTKGSSSAIKDYGRMLVSDHTRADQQLAEYLKKRGLDLASLATTTSADPSHSMTADQFGATFDRTFAEQMARDHQRTITVVETARDKTGDAELKALYGQFLQTLQAHHKTAHSLAKGHDGGTGKGKGTGAGTI